MSIASTAHEERAGRRIVATRDNRVIELQAMILKELKAMNMHLAEVSEERIDSSKIKIEGE